MYMINILIYNRLCRLEARCKPEVEYPVSVIISFWLLLYILTILVGLFIRVHFKEHVPLLIQVGRNN